MIRKAVMLLIGMALVVSTVYADPTARVTGGNSIGQGPYHTTVAFSLSCDPNSQGNNLVFKSDLADFKLQTLESVTTCTSSLYTGSGSGTLTMDKTRYDNAKIGITLTSGGDAIISFGADTTIPYMYIVVSMDNMKFHSQ